MICADCLSLSDYITGFAVLGQYKEQHIQSAQETAFGQMLNWLQTH